MNINTRRSIAFSFYGAIGGWSTDPDVWEAARAELADIIESASP